MTSTKMSAGLLFQNYHTSLVPCTAESDYFTSGCIYSIKLIINNCFLYSDKYWLRHIEHWNKNCRYQRDLHCQSYGNFVYDEACHRKGLTGGSCKVWVTWRKYSPQLNSSNPPPPYTQHTNRQRRLYYSLLCVHCVCPDSQYATKCSSVNI
jgi:hypothetical protein